MPNFISNITTGFQNTLLTILTYSWQLIMFVILFAVFSEIWLWRKQTIFKNNIVWTMLEIVPPREVRKSPKAMEQILTAIYSLRNAPGDFFEKWIDGEVTQWFSLEIASFEGEIHFFLRTPIKFKNVIEANLYAHYPDIQVNVVDDYMNRFPNMTKDLYKQGLDIFGSELTLTKDDAYPIRTYPQFEAIEDEQKVDPISSLLENLGKLKSGEDIFIQFLIKPADSLVWKKQGEKLVEELKSKLMMEIPGAETGKIIKSPRIPTPGETDIMKAIENSMTKPGFETVIRILYIAPKTIYDNTFANKGFMGILNQYSSMSLNSFTHNINIRTQLPKRHKYPY